MINKILLAALMGFVISCTSDKGTPNAQKAPEKSAAELNVIKEVELETRSSNESEESNYYKATLYLTDYDKYKNQAVAVIDGIFDDKRQNFDPYVGEVCFVNDICGMTFTNIASLEDVTLEQAIGEINRSGLRDSRNIDKKMFTNGAVLLIHSDTRENDKSPIWSITVAVEIKDFKKNAKRVKLRYKVLQYKLKEISV